MIVQTIVAELFNRMGENTHLCKKKTISHQPVPTKKLTIADWDLQDRPREKLMQKGASALSDAELLAILIGSGSPKETAVQLMQRVLNDHHNNLNTLGKCSIRELCQYHGIAEAKAITILAACELGKRRQREKVEERNRFTSAKEIYDYMLPSMQDLDTEEAWVVLMNQSYKLIRSVRLSHGGITETAVDVRIIMREALLSNATVIALCHNHPSGNTRPSRDDDNLTQRVKQAAETMRLYLLDHVIVTDGAYYSYRENGRL